MSVSDKYLITRATIALFWEDDRHVAHQIPAGSVIMIDSGTFDGEKLVEVLWAEKKVMMFTRDIRERGKKVD